MKSKVKPGPKSTHNGVKLVSICTYCISYCSDYCKKCGLPICTIHAEVDRKTKTRWCGNEYSNECRAEQRRKETKQ